MSLLMHDLAAGRISITDERAFEVGKNSRRDARIGRVRERADPADPVRADDAKVPRGRW
jgi:hypothetical protein